MNQFINTINARVFPLSQGASRQHLGVIKYKQGFSGRIQVKNLVHEQRLRLASWNIGSLTGKTMELVDCMVRRKIGIICLQETKWVGEKAKEIENTGYKLYYTGLDRNRNGV